MGGTLHKTTHPLINAVSTMLRPRSIAVVGATTGSHFGSRLLISLLQGGYSGKIYPVNPRYPELMGVPCYPSVSALPEAPELVVILVSVQRTLPALEEAAQKGARAAVIITSGFAEQKTAEGQDAQQALKDFARRTGLRLCGPNCLGVANVNEGTWACATTLERITGTRKGDLALISQSGGSAFMPLLERAHDRGIGLAYIVSTGNEADLELADFVRYCIHDADAGAVLAFIETVRDGEKFREAAQEALAVGKPIVALKIGRSAAGERAAASHTGAITGSDRVYDALFHQYGITRVDDWDELLEVGSALAKRRPLRKRTLAVVASSGGIGSLLADKCGEIVELPPLSPDTKQGLEEILQGFGSATNPADVTRFANGEEFARILDLMLSDDAFGGLVIAAAGDDDQARRIIQAAGNTDKPVLILWSASERATSGLPLLQRSHLPVFFRASNLVRGLKACLLYEEARDRWLADHPDEGRQA